MRLMMTRVLVFAQSNELHLQTQTETKTVICLGSLSAVALDAIIAHNFLAHELKASGFKSNTTGWSLI